MKKYILLIALLTGQYAGNAQEITFDTLSVKKYGLTFKNGVVLDLVYEFVYPTNDTPNTRRIRDLMILDFFGTVDSLIMPLKDASERYEKAILEDYATQQPNTKHQYSTQYSAIRIVNNKVLVLMMQQYFDMGGAHGLEPSSYSCYDLVTGERLTLDDLVSRENQAKILRLIREQLLVTHSKDISEKATIENALFMLLPKGILFTYNQYWIGSYADGIIRATIPYSKFRHLLKPSAQQYFYE